MDLGQLVMGYALLKGLGAPTVVSSAVIDARTGGVIEANVCKISKVRNLDDRLEDSCDSTHGLPWNLGTFGALNFRFVPIPENLNRYLLAVRNLPAGEYDILGRPGCSAMPPRTGCKAA